MKRVVITGAGTINALGHDVPQTLEAMKNGTCGIGPLDFRDVDRLMISASKPASAFINSPSTEIVASSKILVSSPKVFSMLNKSL